MRGTFQLNRTDDMEATLTVSMKIAQWKELQKQISTSYPGWKFASMIDAMIRTASQCYENDTKLDP